MPGSDALLRRRDFLLRLAASGALGGAGLAGMIRNGLAAGEHPAVPGLRSAKGDVRVNRELARPGRLIKPGDLIVTGKGAEAVYVVGQDAFLQRENTQISFGADAAKDFFRVVTGRVLSVFGTGNKTLLTSTATIGIRGTGCYIEAEDTRVYFCLCYGTADVVPVADPALRQTIRTRHHDHPVWINHAAGVPVMADASVQNHSDAELVLLENLVGRWPPFGSQGNY